MELRSGYKQTEVGVIPEDWELKPIGESFDICNHLRYPISQDVRKKMVGEYPYYGPTKAQDYINEYRVEGEYALIGEDGDHFLKWRESPMTLLVNGKFNVNNHAHLVKGVRNLTSWFYYYFQNRDITSYLTRQGAGRYKLTKNTLITIPCPLPSPSEQRIIVAALSDVDALITSLDRLIAKKRDIKQATMQQLLTGKTRLPGFSGEWGVKKLGEVGKPYGGLSGKSKEDFANGQYPYIPFLNIMNNPIIDINYFDYVNIDPGESQNKVIKGDLFFNGSSETPEEVGMCSVLNEDIPNLYLNSFCFGFRLNKELKTNGLYLSYYFRSSVGRQLFYSLAQGATRYNLSKSNFLKMEIPYPEPEEQTSIATILTDMDAEIVSLEQKHDKTRALKQGMMQELLTGKTRLI